MILRIKNWVNGPGFGAMLAVFLTSGCGYSWGFRPVGDAKSIAVPMLDNQTDRVELEMPLTEAIRREIAQRTTLILRAPGEADLLLTGGLQSVEIRVLAEDALDAPRFTTVHIQANFRLIDQRTGKVWRRQALRLEFAETDARLDAAMASAQDDALRSMAERVVFFLDEGWNPADEP